MTLLSFRTNQEKFKNNSLVYGTLVYTGATIINAAIPFVLLPILTRYLPPEEYGQVAMFATLVMALNAFTGINVHGAANRKFFDVDVNHAAMQRFITSCLVILLVSSTVVAFGVFLARGYLSEWLDLPTKWLLLAVLVSAMMCIDRIRLGQWQIRKRPLPYGAFQVGRSAINMSLSLVLVILFMTNAGGRIWGYVIAAVLAGLTALVLLCRDKLVGLQLSKQHVVEATKFGAPLVPHVAGAFLLLAIDRVIINEKLGLAAAGIYMVAVQCSLGVGMLLDSFNRAYQPSLFALLKNGEYAEKVRVIQFTYCYFVALAVGAMLGFVIGPYVVVFVAGPGYEAAGQVIGWLVAAQCLRGMYLMVTNYIFYSKRTGVVARVTIACGVVNVLLLFVLVDHYGMVGAGVALCCAWLIQFFWTWRAASKEHPMPWLQFGKLVGKN